MNTEFIISRIKLFLILLYEKIFPGKIEEKYNLRGILIKKPASECKVQQGYPVTTIDGDNGTIIKFYDRAWNTNKERWLDLKLDNNSYKHVRTNNIFVLFIYLPLTKRYYPLSHGCYKYLTTKDEFSIFQFRITNRGYAMLSDSTKQSREYIAMLRKSRYGANFLTRVEELKYKITKL